MLWRNRLNDAPLLPFPLMAKDSESNPQLPTFGNDNPLEGLGRALAFTAILCSESPHVKDKKQYSEASLAEKVTR